MNPSDDAAPSTPSARPGRAPAAGDTLAERYRLVQRIASGGSAEVFEAEHLTTKRRVAVKVLRTSERAETASVERFFREASACAGIDSDHIVAVLDCDVDRPSGAPFIVMELLHGKDLARFIADTLAQGTPVPPSLAMSLLKQVASALDKVHAQWIVHRDLKPANLFLSFPSDGPPRVKVLDFGIASIAADGLGGGSRRAGTPLYMSAEQLAGSESITPAADIWSFSLIAYELLVGHPYWENNTAVSLFARIPDAEAHPKPTELAVRHGVHLPRAFDTWLLRCIDPNPAARPTTVGEALGDLLRLYDPKATQPPSRASIPAAAAIPSRLAPRATASRPPPPRVSVPSPSRPSAPVAPVPPRPSAAPAIEPPRSAPPAPPAPLSPATESLDDDELEELTETSDLPPELRATVAAALPIEPSPAASEARTLRVSPISERVVPIVERDDDDRRPTVQIAPVVASLFGPPLRTEAAADERVTAEHPAANLPSTAAPRALPPEPDPEPVDTLGANVDAALEAPDAPRPRRVPRALELASTALLPVQAPPPPPPPAVKPITLIAAAVATLGLAGTAGWVLLRDPVAPVTDVRADGVWRSPSAFENASLASTTSAWAGALRARVDASPAGTDASPAGTDAARSLYALLEAHRAGVALPPDRQVAMLVALDRLRTPGGWPAPEHTIPDAEATARAALAYAAMAEITHAETARVRVEVARNALVALQSSDGSFDAAYDPVTAPLHATSLALSALLVAETAAPDARPDAVAARRRAVHLLRSSLQRADHPVWSVPAALDAAVSALWAARAQTHDADPADDGVAARYADHLGERCPDQRCAVIPPLAEAPWVPGALVTAARLLRDSTSLPPSSLRALSAFVRAGVAAVDRDRAYSGGGDTRWLASALASVSELAAVGRGSSGGSKRRRERGAPGAPARGAPEGHRGDITGG